MEPSFRFIPPLAIALSLGLGVLHASSTSVSPVGHGQSCGGCSHLPGSQENELEALVANAELVGDFEVIDKRYEELADGIIQTVFTFATITPIKGSLASIQEIRIPGGEVAGRGLFIPGMPRLEVGDRHILFLSSKDEYKNWRVPVGLGSGAFRVLRDARGRRTVARAKADNGDPYELQDHGDFVAKVIGEVARQRTR